MRRWLSGAALLAACAAHAQPPAALTLVTDDNHPPYAYADRQGRPAGVYVDIVRSVLQRMPEYRVTITAVPWRRALAMTEAGEASGIFPPHLFSGQRPYLHRFSEPILEEVPVAVCEDKALAALPHKPLRWPEDFVSLGFGVSSGVRMGGERFWDLVGQGRIHTEQAPGVMENLKKLAYGRVACHINDRLTIQWAWAALARAQPALASVHITEAAAMPAEHGYLSMGQAAAAREPFQQAFLARFNQQLRALRDSGELDRIVRAALAQAQPDPH